MLSQATRIFLQIVESQSITAAASALDLTKSAVSQQLTQLETTLGVRLLNRTTRRQSLTPLGEFYHQQCLAAVNLQATTIDELSHSATELSGSLVVTVPHALVDPLAAPALQKLIERHPRMSPTLLADDQRLDLLKHSIDLAITVGQLKDSELMAQRVGSFTMYLCVAPSYLQSHLPTIKSGELSHDQIAQLAFIGAPWQGKSVRLSLSVNNNSDAYLLELTPTRRVNTVLAADSLARAGAGLVLLPAYIARAGIESGQLLRLLPDHDLPESSVYAVHPYRSMPPLSVRLFIETLKSCVAEGVLN